jgi:hypothetical protein
MSEKKISRRAVLGTAIAGVAGATAIVHVLRNKYETVLPPGHYESDWEAVLKMIEIPIEVIDGPPSVTLRFNPPMSAPTRLVCVHAGYEDSPASYPSLPDYYSFTEGRVTGTSPVIDNRPAMLISVTKSIDRGSAFQKEDPSAEGILVVRNGAYDIYKTEAGFPKIVPAGKVANGCAALATSVFFPLPEGKELAKGAKWTIPATSHFGVELACEVAGFAEITGRNTVKMAAREVSHSQKLQPQSRQNWARRLDVTSYVDVITGTAVRQCCVLSEPRANAVPKQLAVLISQVVQS